MILQRIERHLRANRMPPTRFGRDAVGDPNLVFNLRDGREPRPRTVARILSFIERQSAGASAESQR